MAPSKQPKLKLPYSSLALLDWLCEKGPGQRLLGTGGGLDARGYYFFEVTGTDPKTGKQQAVRVLPARGATEDKKREHELLERLGGSDNPESLKMSRAGFFDSVHPLGFSDRDQRRGRNRYEEFVARFDDPPFNSSDGISFASPAAFEYWESVGRAEFARLWAERQQAKRSARRMIVVGRLTDIRGELPKEIRRKIPEDLHLPLPAFETTYPAYTAIVTRETGNRLYVSDVKTLPEIGDADWRDRPIHGSEPNQFIAREKVLLDHATPEDVERLRRIETEFNDDVQRITLQTIEQVLPALTDMYSRLKQKKAERDDTVGEFMEAKGQKRRKPGPEEEPGGGTPSP